MEKPISSQWGQLFYMPGQLDGINYSDVYNQVWQPQIDFLSQYARSGPHYAGKIPFPVGYGPMRGSITEPKQVLFRTKG